MTAPTDTLDGPKAAPALSAAALKLRPLGWSLRRELWENKAIVRAPLIAAAVVLCGLILGRLSAHQPAANQMREHMPPPAPYFIAWMAIACTGIVVAVFYCLGALYGERRDRSILFWKSLPVSNLTAVLAKFAVPTLAVPAIAIVVSVVTHLLMMGFSMAYLLANGQDPGVLWAAVDLPYVWGIMLYGLAVVALWQAPFWAWILLISAWAKRTPILWLIGPPIALSAIEQIAFGTKHVSEFVGSRIMGGLFVGVSFAPHQQGLPTPELHPVRFITSPELWGGFVAAAALLLAAAWLRRRADPI